MTTEDERINNLLPLAGECEEREWYRKLLARKDENIRLAMRK